MNKKIIALVGETGAGKDTFANLAKERFSSVKLLRFSDPLSETLGIFFNKIKKEDQQWLANSLRDRFGEDILMKSLGKKIEEAEEEVVIVNGLRVKEELDFIKYKKGVVIYITLETKKRWERVKERKEKKDDDVSFEDFLRIDKGRTERQIKEIGKMADVKIDNEGSVEDLKKEVERVINILK